MFIHKKNLREEMYASKQVAKVGKVKTNYVIMKCYLRNLEHKMGQGKIQ